MQPEASEHEPGSQENTEPHCPARASPACSWLARMLKPESNVLFPHMKEHRLKGMQPWERWDSRGAQVWHQAGFVCTLGMSLHLSGPQLAHLYTGDNKSDHLVGLSWGLKITHLKCLIPDLEHCDAFWVNIRYNYHYCLLRLFWKLHWCRNTR